VQPAGGNQPGRDQPAHADGLADVRSSGDSARARRERARALSVCAELASGICVARGASDQLVRNFTTQQRPEHRKSGCLIVTSPVSRKPGQVHRILSSPATEASSSTAPTATLRKPGKRRRRSPRTLGPYVVKRRGLPSTMAGQLRSKRLMTGWRGVLVGCHEPCSTPQIAMAQQAGHQRCGATDARPVVVPQRRDQP
jgi:hypothetical protein